MPILFTPHLQKRLNFQVAIRETVGFIKRENPYLFPVTQSADNCVRASEVICKFGNDSGAKLPENITFTRLRKYVATVSQLLNLSEGDKEQ